MINYIAEYKYKRVDWTDFKKIYEQFIRENYDNNRVNKILNEIDWNKCLA